MENLGSNIGDRRSSRRTALLSFCVTLVLSGLGGFLLGRYTTLLAEPEPQPPTDTQPDQPPPAPATQTAESPPAPGSPAEPAPDQPEELKPPAEYIRRLEAKISGSLYATLSKEIEGRAADILNAQLGRVLLWWFDMHRDVLKGDRIQVLYKTPVYPTVLSVMAVRYTSEKSQKTFTAYLFKPEGSPYGRYYDENGQEIEQRLINAPLEHYEQVTALMNLTGRRHRGVDFKTDVGTLVRAPFRSKVLRRNWNTRSNGYCLEIKYLDSGIHAFFLHLDEVMPEAKPGVVVEAGTKIARAGNTGHSTAPHLHYELRSASGRQLNPFKVHETTQVKLEGEELTEFQARRAELNKRLLQTEPAVKSAPSLSESKASNINKE